LGNPNWKKGQSGNPATMFKPGRPGPGRPRKLPITDRYRKAVEEPLPDVIRLRLKLKKGATVGDAIARAMAWQAIRGDVPAVREITDRLEGRATERIELTDKHPTVQIAVIYEGREPAHAVEAPPGGALPQIVVTRSDDPFPSAKG
jgi:uncharacterized protein DUF5681